MTRKYRGAVNISREIGLLTLASGGSGNEKEDLQRIKKVISRRDKSPRNDLLINYFGQRAIIVRILDASSS